MNQLPNIHIDIKDFLAFTTASGGLTDIVHIFVFCIIDRDFDDIKFIFGSVRWNWLVLCA